MSLQDELEHLRQNACPTCGYQIDRVARLLADRGEAAALLDRLAERYLDYWNMQAAAECRAQARKLRGET